MDSREGGYGSLCEGWSAYRITNVSSKLSMSDTPTPRTDAFIEGRIITGKQWTDFARTLERELETAKAYPDLQAAIFQEDWAKLTAERDRLKAENEMLRERMIRVENEMQHQARLYMGAKAEVERLLAARKEQP